MNMYIVDLSNIKKIYMHLKLYNFSLSTDLAAQNSTHFDISHFYYNLVKIFSNIFTIPSFFFIAYWL